MEKNEILVVSFGTSFNDSRAEDIGGMEKALQAAYPDWSVRRAFTAQIIINHVQARDDEKIDNMDQALERAVDNGVKNLVVQPTHLMHGAEYDELTEAVESYKDKFESVKLQNHFLVKLEQMRQQSMRTKQAVAEAITAEAVKTAGFDSLMQQQKTEQHLYSWDMELPIQQRSVTLRCRHRWNSLVIRMYSSEP